MIRLATINDIAGILPLAVKFIEYSPLSGKTFINYGDLSDTLSMMISEDKQACWVMVVEGKIVGMSGAMIFPFYANRDYQIAQELFWYVAEEHRGNGKQLLNAMENWSTSRGAKALHMISLETDSAKAMDRYYKRSGFNPIEHTYSKEL